MFAVCLENKHNIVTTSKCDDATYKNSQVNDLDNLNNLYFLDISTSIAEKKN